MCGHRVRGCARGTFSICLKGIALDEIFRTEPGAIRLASSHLRHAQSPAISLSVVLRDALGSVGTGVCGHWGLWARGARGSVARTAARPT